MTRLVLRSALAALAFAFVLPAAATAQTDDEREVLGVVKRMLSVLESKDAASVAGLVDSTTRFTLTRPLPTGGSRVLVLTGEQFLQAVTRPGPTAVEKIRNPEVRIDGDLATVWAEYQVLIDGSLSHCGFDAFHLARTAVGWKVVNVSDSYRQSCGDPWPDA